MSNTRKRAYGTFLNVKQPLEVSSSSQTLNRRELIKKLSNTPKSNTRFGEVEFKIVDHADESKNKSRMFILRTMNKPTVTIVDNDPDNPGITGTIRVLGVSYPFNLTQEQINEAYGVAISGAKSESVVDE